MCIALNLYPVGIGWSPQHNIRERIVAKQVLRTPYMINIVIAERVANCLKRNLLSAPPLVRANARDRCSHRALSRLYYCSAATIIDSILAAIARIRYR